MNETQKMRFYLIMTYLLSLIFFIFAVFAIYGIHNESIEILHIFKIIFMSPFITLIAGLYVIKDFNPNHLPNIFILLFSLFTYLFVIVSVIKAKNVILNIIGHLFLVIYWILGLFVIGMAI